MATPMTPERFKRLSRRDFANGAVLDDILAALAGAERLRERFGDDPAKVALSAAQWSNAEADRLRAENAAMREYQQKIEAELAEATVELGMLREQNAKLRAVADLCYARAPWPAIMEAVRAAGYEVQHANG